jgi:shikimate kinase
MGHAAPAHLFPNIYLIGLMGSGKSTIGQCLSAALQREFVDLDRYIEASAQKSIAAIFREHGESYFRELESHSLHEISRKQSRIVALGGGAILKRQNRDLLKSTGFRIFLKARPEILLDRLAHDEERPLLASLDPSARLTKLRELEKARSPFYEDADLIVENESTSEVAIEKILQTLRTLCDKSK